MRRQSSSGTKWNGDPPQRNGRHDPIQLQSQSDNRSQGTTGQNLGQQGPTSTGRASPSPMDVQPLQSGREQGRNGGDDIDDAEKVDYGSEEGEL